MTKARVRLGEEQPDFTVSEASAALVLPIALVSLIESFTMLIAIRLFRGSRFSLFVLQHGHWLLAGAAAIETYWLCRRGRQGLLASAAGWAVAYFIIWHFRGSREWDGTFAMYDRNPFYWQLALLLGMIAGAAAGLLKADAANPSGGKWRITAIALLMAACCASWADANVQLDLPIFAPTRQLALFALLVGVALMHAAELIFQRYSNEKGLLDS